MQGQGMAQFVFVHVIEFNLDLKYFHGLASSHDMQLEISQEKCFTVASDPRNLQIFSTLKIVDYTVLVMLLFLSVYRCLTTIMVSIQWKWVSKLSSTNESLGCSHSTTTARGLDWNRTSHLRRWLVSIHTRIYHRHGFFLMYLYLRFKHIFWFTM